MLSRISSLALLSLVLTGPLALAQNTGTVVGRNAVNEAVRAREAEEAARRNDQNGGVAGEIGPLEVRPEDPVIDTGVHAPTDFTIPGYGRTDVSLRWWNNGGAQTRIYRSISDGPWTALQTFGALPTGAYADFQDQSATMDAENCYRVSVSDGVNNSSAQSSPVRCAFTRRHPDFDGTVSRLQLRIQIASAADADTDNTNEARLQSPTNITYANTYWRPAGNSTWIDSTADDFERSTNRTYDLMLTNIGHVSDITQITLAKPGDDDACIAGLELFIDNTSAFSRSYGNSTSQCQWIHGDDVLSINFADLRAQPSFTNFSTRTFPGFDGPGLRSLIEAKFGHFLHGLGELQNGIPVTTARASQTRLNVAVPVRVYDVTAIGDVDSIVRFDLVIGVAADGQTQLTVENVNANSSDLLLLLAPILVAPVLYEVSEQIEAQINGIGASNVGGTPPAGTRHCFTETAGLGICYPNQ
jgi:hypothetical protein